MPLAYEKVAYWKKKKLIVPSREAGKRFIDDILKSMTEWLHDSPLNDIVFKTRMDMPSLLLQKPTQKSKSKDHLKEAETI